MTTVCHGKNIENVDIFIENMQKTQNVLADHILFLRMSEVGVDLHTFRFKHWLCYLRNSL